MISSFIHHETPVYSYFVDGTANGLTRRTLGDIRPEMNRLGEALSSSSDLPPSREDIIFLAEVILQMSAHGIPGFDPADIESLGFRNMFAAAHSLMFQVMKRPFMPIDILMTANPKEIKTKHDNILRIRHAMLCVLNDRAQGVRLDLSEYAK